VRLISFSAVPTSPAVQPAGGLVVRAIEEELALYQQPAGAGPVIKQELSVRRAASSWSQPKRPLRRSAKGQWLKVRYSRGREIARRPGRS
jgi:hypothetical protein